MASVNNPRFSNQGRQSSDFGGQGRRGSERGENQGTAATGGTGSSVLESARESAENLAAGATSAAEQAWDVTRERAQQAAQYAEDAWGTTNDFMRQYPLVTLGIGICMGVCLCLTLQGRRD